MKQYRFNKIKFLEKKRNIIVCTFLICLMEDYNVIFSHQKNQTIDEMIRLDQGVESYEYFKFWF